MTSILIVDDEPLIRRGLESMIPWESLQCQLADQASNGQEGLKKIRQHHPDIVFTDIRMPVMDGLQMIEEAQRGGDHPVFIILSGYNDFELVRSAMRLGAIDYLTKLNLDEKELISLIQTAKTMIQPAKQPAAPSPSTDFKKSFIAEMLRLKPDKNLLFQQMPQNFTLQKNHFYRILCFHLTDAPITFQDSASKQDLPQTFLDNLCIEQFPECIDSSVYHLSDSVTTVYIEYQGNLSPDTLTLKCQNLITSVRRYLNQPLSIGISAPHQNIMHISTAYEEAMESLAYHVSGIDASIHFYTDLLNADSLKRQIQQLNTENLFFESAENLMLQIQKYMTQSNVPLKEASEICFLLISHLYHFDTKSQAFFIQWFHTEYTSSGQLLMTSSEAYTSWILHLSQGINHYSQQYMNEIYRYKVKKAKEYIYQNRLQKISLNEVAAMLEITPSYLSRIFKKVTQKSFSDYVAEIKIEEAKSLLLKDNNRIYEVSSILGYDDPYYFSKVFKKITQMTPSEFIAHH